MSYSKAQVAALTLLARQLQNNPELANTFAQHMLAKFPSEALRFTGFVSRPVYRDRQVNGVLVRAEVQEWVDANASNYNNYKNFSVNGVNHLINAIKELREKFNLGLREAKYATDGYPYKKA